MKIGVVVEGGASRTYFAVGVMDVLMKEGIFADVIVGSSFGITNALSYASRQMTRSYRIGVHHSYKAKYMGVSHLLRPSNRCFYNLDYVFNRIPNEIHPFDYDAFKENGCKTIAVLTDVETGKAEYMPFTPDERGRDVLKATCALPFLFPKMKVDGKMYMDGTIVEPLPYIKALEEGCDKVIVIASRERRFIKKATSVPKIAIWKYRKYPEFVKALRQHAAIYNKWTQRLKQLEDEGKVFVFRPESTFGWKRIEYNPDKIRKIYRRGYNTARQDILRLRQFLEK